MSGAGGGSRVPIPNNVQNTINEIREITGNHHSSDEIYVVLKECSMDPKETAQKLLYLDTFHEVRRRRKRRKEVLSGRVSEESRSKQHGQGRGARGASGGFSSKFFDGGGGRKLAIQRENGVHIAEKTNGSSTQSDLQKITNTPPQASRGSAVVPHNAANPCNGNSGHGSSSQSLIGSVLSLPETSSAANDTVNQENIQHQAVVAVAAITSPKETVSSITSTDQGKYLSSSDQCPSNHVEGNKLEEATGLSASKNEKSRSMNSTSNPNAILKLNEVESNLLSERLSSSLSLNSSLRPPQDVCKIANVTEVSASEAHVQSTEARQRVTYPKHFQVPEALKGGLTFGSFDTFGPSKRSCRATGCDNSPTPETSPGNDEAVTSRFVIYTIFMILKDMV
ncbi:GBF-interacting protein 1 [Lathyrus oleraceus]|uniref:GBF-interacting protein 1 n=1 Tax=Pisum sativum TaxID=3888 RepID=UPI0021CF6611|nr:GBF-interacting protein 1-like [Pisum sativum]